MTQPHRCVRLTLTSCDTIAGFWPGHIMHFISRVSLVIFCNIRATIAISTVRHTHALIRGPLPLPRTLPGIP